MCEAQHDQQSTNVRCWNGWAYMYRKAYNAEGMHRKLKRAQQQPREWRSFLHTVLNLYKKKGHAKLCVSFDDNKAIIKLNTIMIVRMRDFEEFVTQSILDCGSMLTYMDMNCTNIYLI